MKAVDCHCHLNFDRFEDQLEEVLERARENLQFLVSPGCDLDSNREVLDLARKNPEFVVPNLGLHPTRTASFDELQEIKSQIREEKPPAVGEIGLDHHHVEKEHERKRQKKVFREMIELAEDQEKPVVVHSREAESECIEMLVESNVEKVMMHCFNGTVDEAKRAVEEGFKIGVTTQVLYSSRVQAIVKGLDLDNILLETDSPFLYPDGMNEPFHVIESAEKISSIKNVEKEKVLERTSSGARKFFRQK